jgi:hypothetical protein
VEEVTPANKRIAINKVVLDRENFIVFFLETNI